MAIVSWPQTLWRHLTLCIQDARLQITLSLSIVAVFDSSVGGNTQVQIRQGDVWKRWFPADDSTKRIPPAFLRLQHHRWVSEMKSRQKLKSPTNHQKPLWQKLPTSGILLGLLSWCFSNIRNKKLSYRRVTARCVLSVVIWPITTQQCRNYLYDKSWPNRWYEVGGLVGGNVS